MKIRLIIQFMLLASFVACEEIEIPETDQDDDFCEVNFSIGGNDLTRSSATVEDNYIHDMQIWAMSNGYEMDDHWNVIGTFNTMRLRKYEYYNFYAVANIGVFTVSEMNESILRQMRYGFNGIKLLQIFQGIPMSCVAENVYLDSDKVTVNLPFERMLAEYYVSIDKSHLTNTQVNVTSAKLMQAPTDMYVFLHDSKAVATEDGDYMTKSDLDVLNSGGPVKLYAVENCQGVLIPGNTDPKKKVPSSLYPETASKCTYLEIKASFSRKLPSGETVSGDDLTYRYYLGKDATTDFSVVRNTSNILTLVLSELDLEKSSWRISPGDYY